MSDKELRLEALKAENERLRAALEELVHIGPSSTMGDFKRAQARALEALGRNNDG